MLLDLEKISKDAREELIPLAQSVYKKKLDGSIKYTDYALFEKKLGEVARGVLVGHKELLYLNQVISDIASNEREVEFFTKKRTDQETKEYLCRLAKKFN